MDSDSLADVYDRIEATRQIVQASRQMVERARELLRQVRAGLAYDLVERERFKQSLDGTANVSLLPLRQ